MYVKVIEIVLFILILHILCSVIVSRFFIFFVAGLKLVCRHMALIGHSTCAEMVHCAISITGICCAS